MAIKMIKLTFKMDDRPCFVNCAAVQAVYEYQGKTIVDFGKDNYVEIKESVEYVVNMIEQETK